jgi:hypothetical protein
MNRYICIPLFIEVWVGIGNSQVATERLPIFVIQQPTIIAFFPITQAEVDSGEDNAEALGDFDYYISLAEKRLHRAGIAIRVVNAPSFQIQTGKKLVSFQPNKKDIGYYFIAPGKKAHIEHNVMTDEDILDAARKYFVMAIPREHCRTHHCSK